MMYHKKQRLIIFVKSPVPGKVKTRLANAPECSDEKACNYYQAMVACVLQHVNNYVAESEQMLDLYVGYTLSDDEQAIKDWLEPHLSSNSKISMSYFKQVDSPSLGDRIRVAFADSFAEGYDYAGIIGTDCVDITPSVLGELFSENVAAIGPTHDGGYYSLGLSSLPFKQQPELLARLFADVRWSTEMTYQDSVEAAEAIELDLHVLPKLHDIDYYADWQRALSSSQGPRLKQQLKQIERALS